MRRVVIVSVLACILGALVALPVLAEMKGLWVDSFHPGFKSPEETTALIAKAKACGFNTLFVQVRRRGDVYYSSKIEPMAADAASGYDPLADVVEKAHAEGMEVHAWVTCFEVYHDTKWTKMPAGHIYSKHPEWAMKDEKGRVKFPGDKVFLDPGVPEVRSYLAAIVQEIISGYAVDGIHLDMVKYPSQFSGYNDASIAKFKLETGTAVKPQPADKTFGDWRRAQVTQFVELAKEKVKQSGKPLKLSAVAVANRMDALGNRFQDWAGWLKAGTLDFVVAMVFPMDDRVFSSQAADALAAADAGKVYIGQAAWRMSTEQSLGQLDIAKQAGAPGYVLFNYTYACKTKPGDKLSVMDALAKGSE